MKRKFKIHIHKYKRVSELLMVEKRDSFDTSPNMCAIGKCVKCGKLKMIKAYGSFSGHRSDIKTEGEHMKNYIAGLK